MSIEKHLGLLSITIIWFGLIFLISRWKGDKSMTFSLHAAQSRSAQVYYFLLFALTMPLFYVFVWNWFVPTFMFSSILLWIVAAGLVGQFIAVSLPETDGWKVPVHRNGAFFMSLTLIPFNLLIAMNQNISTTARVIAFAAFCIQLIICAMLLPAAGHHKQVLWLQGVYIAVFHIAIIAATYFG